MGVPIHVWQPPLIESAVGKRVVLSEVAGPKQTADQLRERLLSNIPNDTGRQTLLSEPGHLNQSEAVRLVSATDDAPSDIALRAAASHEGYDYVLRGEVLKDRRPAKVQAADKRLTVSWRLMKLDQQPTDEPLPSQRQQKGAPVVVDRESAIKKYPDLGILTDENAILATAAVRDTYRLITPSVRRDEVKLTIPYLMPGSAATRKGNVAALSGRWDEATRIWNDVAERNPLQVAATHNLALAAVAAQDFSTARKTGKKGNSSTANTSAQGNRIVD